jgi:hypothetical protein
MRIRSALGKGTIVTVRLPLSPQCQLPKEEAAQSSARSQRFISANTPQPRYSRVYAA